MNELAAEYKKSVAVLNKRINEILKYKDFLVSRTKDPETNQKIIELDDRLKPLRIMQNDLKEVTKEIENYFNKGWWRSERYTLNSRKSRKFVYCEPIYYDECD